MLMAKMIKMERVEMENASKIHDIWHLHVPIQVPLACFVVNYVLPTKILKRSSNIGLFQTKHA